MVGMEKAECAFLGGASVTAESVRTAPNSEDLRTLTVVERYVAGLKALGERDRRVRRVRVEEQIKRDLDYGRDR